MGPFNEVEAAVGGGRLDRGKAPSTPVGRDKGNPDNAPTIRRPSPSDANNRGRVGSSLSDYSAHAPRYPQISEHDEIAQWHRREDLMHRSFKDTFITSETRAGDIYNQDGNGIWVLHKIMCIVQKAVSGLDPQGLSFLSEGSFQLLDNLKTTSEIAEKGRPFLHTLARLAVFYNEIASKLRSEKESMVNYLHKIIMEDVEQKAENHDVSEDGAEGPKEKIRRLLGNEVLSDIGSIAFILSYYALLLPKDDPRAKLILVSLRTRLDIFKPEKCQEQFLTDIEEEIKLADDEDRECLVMNYFLPLREKSVADIAEPLNRFRPDSGVINVINQCSYHCQQAWFYLYNRYNQCNRAAYEDKNNNAQQIMREIEAFNAMLALATPEQAENWLMTLDEKVLYKYRDLGTVVSAVNPEGSSSPRAGAGGDSPEDESNSNERKFQNALHEVVGNFYGDLLSNGSGDAEIAIRIAIRLEEINRTQDFCLAGSAEQESASAQEPFSSTFNALRLDPLRQDPLYQNFKAAADLEPCASGLVKLFDWDHYSEASPRQLFQPHSRNLYAWSGVFAEALPDRTEQFNEDGLRRHLEREARLLARQPALRLAVLDRAVLDRVDQQAESLKIKSLEHYNQELDKVIELGLKTAAGYQALFVEFDQRDPYFVVSHCAPYDSSGARGDADNQQAIESAAARSRQDISKAKRKVQQAFDPGFAAGRIVAGMGPEFKDTWISLYIRFEQAYEQRLDNHEASQFCDQVTAFNLALKGVTEECNARQSVAQSELREAERVLQGLKRKKMTRGVRHRIKAKEQEVATKKAKIAKAQSEIKEAKEAFQTLMNRMSSTDDLLGLTEHSGPLVSGLADFATPSRVKAALGLQLKKMPIALQAELRRQTEQGYHENDNSYCKRLAKIFRVISHPHPRPINEQLDKQMSGCPQNRRIPESANLDAVIENFLGCINPAYLPAVAQHVRWLFSNHESAIPEQELRDEFSKLMWFFLEHNHQDIVKPMIRPGITYCGGAATVYGSSSSGRVNCAAFYERAKASLEQVSINPTSKRGSRARAVQELSGRLGSNFARQSVESLIELAKSRHNRDQDSNHWRNIYDLHSWIGWNANALRSGIIASHSAVGADEMLPPYQGVLEEVFGGHLDLLFSSPSQSTIYKVSGKAEEGYYQSAITVMGAIIAYIRETVLFGPDEHESEAILTMRDDFFNRLLARDDSPENQQLRDNLLMHLQEAKPEDVARFMGNLSNYDNQEQAKIRFFINRLSGNQRSRLVLKAVRYFARLESINAYPAWYKILLRDPKDDFGLQCLTIKKAFQDKERIKEGVRAVFKYADSSREEVTDLLYRSHGIFEFNYHTVNYFRDSFPSQPQSNDGELTQTEALVNLYVLGQTQILSLKEKHQYAKRIIDRLAGNEDKAQFVDKLLQRVFDGSNQGLQYLAETDSTTRYTVEYNGSQRRISRSFYNMLNHLQPGAAAAIGSASTGDSMAQWALKTCITLGKQSPMLMRAYSLVDACMRAVNPQSSVLNQSRGLDKDQAKKFLSELKAIAEDPQYSPTEKRNALKQVFSGNTNRLEGAARKELVKAVLFGLGIGQEGRTTDNSLDLPEGFAKGCLKDLNTSQSWFSNSTRYGLHIGNSRVGLTHTVYDLLKFLGGNQDLLKAGELGTGRQAVTLSTPSCCLAFGNYSFNSSGAERSNDNGPRTSPASPSAQA